MSLEKVSKLGGRRPIDHLIVHCSDSPDDRTWVDVKEIGRWHVARGFRKVGYHYVIKKDGTVETGRSHEVVGAHCYGHNQFTLGICWVGRSDLNRAQRAALVDLLVKLAREYALTADAVKGHCEFDPHKTCPNLDMTKLRKDVSSHLAKKAT